MNPWLVENLTVFSFLCCPECTYRSKEYETFEVHALQNHPLSLSFFNKERIQVKDEPPFDSEITIEDQEMKEETSEAKSKPKILSEDTIEDNEVIDEEESKPKKSIKDYKCSFCSKTFKKRNSLREHIRTQHDHPVDCDECDEKCENPSKLTKHKYLKHTLVKCEECNKSFLKALYIRHMKTFHVSKDHKPFGCDLCPYKTHAQRYLSEHKSKYHCQKNSSDNSSFNYYDLMTNEDGFITCSTCQHQVRGKGILIHYQKSPSCLPSGFKDSKRFICDQCSKDFASMRSLKKHITNAHDVQEAVCPQCSMSFSNQSTLKKHLASIHQLESLKTNHCKECMVDFKEMRYYIIHYRSVHKDLPPEVKDKPQFICDQCPDSFLSEYNLKQHISRIHANNGLIKPHLKLRKYPKKKCPDCSKIFKCSNALQEHVLVKHKNITPHHCDQCSRKFGLAGTLRDHKKLVHTKVRCDICSDEICNSFVLKRHKASVHGIVPNNVFRCQSCPMFFHSGKSLQNHIDVKHS